MNIFRGFINKNELDLALAKAIISDIRKAIASKGSAYILFSGGSTPKGLFNELYQQNIDWDLVKIGLVDDRMVDEQSEHSNAAMLKKLLMGKITGDKKPIFLPLVYDYDDFDANITKANEVLKNVETPDVVVLGMGTDGHFASLFPGDYSSEQSLSNLNPEFLVYTVAPNYPKSRITHSWSYLRKASKLYLHITGNEKKDLIRNLERAKLPIDKVLSDKEKTIEIFWSN